jgi:hypothetical protein
VALQRQAQAYLDKRAAAKIPDAVAAALAAMEEQIKVIGARLESLEARPAHKRARKV